MTDQEVKAAFEVYWNRLVELLPEMEIETFALLRIQTFAAFKAGRATR